MMQKVIGFLKSQSTETHVLPYHLSESHFLSSCFCRLSLVLETPPVALQMQITLNRASAAQQNKTSQQKTTKKIASSRSSSTKFLCACPKVEKKLYSWIQFIIAIFFGVSVTAVVAAVDAICTFCCRQRHGWRGAHMHACTWTDGQGEEARRRAEVVHMHVSWYIHQSHSLCAVIGKFNVKLLAFVRIAMVQSQGQERFMHASKTDDKWIYKKTNLSADQYWQLHPF